MSRITVETEKKSLLRKKERLEAQIAERHKKHIAPLESMLKLTEGMLIALKEHENGTEAQAAPPDQ